MRNKEHFEKIAKEILNKLIIGADRETHDPSVQCLGNFKLITNALIEAAGKGPSDDDVFYQSLIVADNLLKDKDHVYTLKSISVVSFRIAIKWCREKMGDK